MLQLNLLPDVKQEYIKAERSRRLVVTVSVIVTACSVGLLVLMLSYSGLQKKHISDLSDDITSSTKELKAKPQISKILTVQNQLGSLTNLHSAKPAVDRFFGFLNQVTPDKVDITNVSVDFTTQTINITGTADALNMVNKYVDTLKFTTYSDGNGAKDQKAFSNVVLANFSITTATSSSGAATSTKPASYSITLQYDPKILNITQTETLSVPKLTTTRSNSDSPTDLFNNSSNNGGGN